MTNFSEPLRKVTPTRYYNDKVHRASFVLPEFARALLEEGSDIRPIFGHALGSNKPAKKILPYCTRSHIGKSPFVARKHFWDGCDAFSMNFMALQTFEGER